MYLETDRLVIRAFDQADAADLHAIFGDAETMENCEPAYDYEKTVDFLTSFCIGRQGALAAAERQTGRVIGYILFKGMEDDVYEIGWIFNRTYWRRGFAYEACRAVIDYAFGTLGAHKIFAEAIDPVKSVGLMKKLGMTPEGVQRSHTRDNHGNWADLYLYGLIAPDAEARKA